MMKAKKLLSLLLVLVMIVSVFAACGSSAPEQKATDAPAAAPAEEPAKEAPKPAEEVHINFFHWKGEEQAIWDEVIASFQDANPNIVVDMEILPEDQFYTTLQARVMAGKGLDVFMINPGSRFNSYLKADPFMDLTGQPFLADLSENFLTSGQADGKQYIVPLSKSFVPLFYNKAIFEELNLTVPQTWEEFMAACEAIKQAGYEVVSTGMAESYTSTWPFASLVVEFSENLDLYRDLASGKIKFTDELFYKILTPMKEMADKGYILEGASGTKFDTSMTLFVSGKAAMLNTGTWSVGAIQAANPDLDFSVMLVPAPGGNLVAGVAPAQAVSISKNSEHPEECLKFMEYIFSKEVMELYGNKTGQEVPNKNAVLENETLMEIAAIGNSGDIYPHYFSEWPDIDQGIIAEITSRALLGEDIDTILNDAQAKLESLNIVVE